MKRILAPILLLTLLFPSLAQGQSLNDWVGKGKGLLCETTGMGCPESVDAKDLVEQNGVYFKKFTEVPFTGKTTGKTQGSFRNGKKHGPWVSYHDNGKLDYKGTYKDGKQHGPWVWFYDNGQLRFKGTYKNGEWDGPWVTYNKDGTKDKKNTGTYKNGKKVK
jgi:antitoxin component YwqK of YwqJK toxin-antitoxin module